MRYSDEQIEEWSLKALRSLDEQQAGLPEHEVCAPIKNAGRSNDWYTECACGAVFHGVFAEEVRQAAAQHLRDHGVHVPEGQWRP